MTTHHMIDSELRAHPCACDSEIDHGRPINPGFMCLMDESNDSEAFAALPECEHCDGTGKNLTGSPWEDRR